MIKINVTILLFLFCINFLFGNNLKSKVDVRFELTSIVFKLADADEFNNNDVQNYMNDIENYFNPFKNDTLIKFVKKIRKDKAIGYDAVSNITSHLLINRNKIYLNPNVNLYSLFENDNRWNLYDVKTFVYLLDKFYKKTNFSDFYLKHHLLYKNVQLRFDNVIEKINVDWFKSFFGKSIPDEEIIINLCNGSSNYSFTIQNIDNSKSYGIVIGCVNVDSTGIPVFNDKIIPTIIHEICHQYTTPMIRNNMNCFLTSAENIFSHVNKEMIKYSYGDSETLVYESINRLCVNGYFKEYPNGFEQYYIKEDEDIGFIWMDDMTTFLENFINNRKIYKLFSDFLPQLENFYKYVSDNFETEQKLYDAKYPKIVSAFPTENSIVSDSICEIRITFSLPMWESSGIIKYGDNTTLIPRFNNVHWSEDKKTFIIPVNLIPNTGYGFKLPHFMFLSEKAYSLSEDFTLKFKTK